MTSPISRRLRVMVLMGGDSNERPISLSTGKMILKALDPTKYEVSAIDTQDLPRLIAPTSSALPGPGTESINYSPTAQEEATQSVEQSPTAYCLLPTPSSAPTPSSLRPDIVFIALHGKGGEDGTVQGMLEMIGLPYTGSGVMASALAMNKAMTKRLLRSEGIPVIEDVQVRRGKIPSRDDLIAAVRNEIAGFPVFVKPNAEGSTFGCSLVETEEMLESAVETALQFDDLVLIERYVRGTEITVGVLGNSGGEIEALPVIEIVPKAAFYDYESKYADGGSEHLIPARLSETLQQAAQQIAMRCHELLTCRGMSRTDMIVSEGRLFVLEINTIPGMTPTSLLPHAADHAGISFSDLLDRLIRYAWEEET